MGHWDVSVLRTATLRRVRQASESGTIKPTRCAGVVDVRLTTSRSHVVLNVATPTSVSATTTGPLRPRGGRPPVPVASSILRSSKSSSAMDSVKDHEGFPVLPLTNQHQHKLAGGCMISVEDQLT